MDTPQSLIPAWLVVALQIALVFERIVFYLVRMLSGIKESDCRFKICSFCGANMHVEREDAQPSDNEITEE